MAMMKRLVAAVICVSLVLMAAQALAATTEPAGAAGQGNSTAWWMWGLTPVGSVLALLFAFVFYKQIMKRDEGTDRMKEIASYVRAGADAYFR